MKMSMKEVIDYLKSFGFNINESTDPLILLLCIILIISIFALLCVINIILYILIVYFLESNSSLNLLVDKLPNILKKIIAFYKNTRIYYILMEFIFILVSLLLIIWLIGRV